MDPPSDQSPSSIAIIFKLIPLILIFLVSLVGNILLARSASRKGYRKTGTNMVILSQAIADLGTTCLVIPFAVPAIFKDKWILGRPLCRLNSFFNLLFTIATLYNLSFLAYDRFLVIVHKTHRVLSCEQARNGIAFIWFIASAISLPWMDIASEKIETVYTPGFYICYLRYYHPFGVFEVFCLLLILSIGAAVPTGIILCSFYRILVVYRNYRSRINPTMLSNVAKFALEQYCRSAFTSLLMIGTTMLFVFPSCFTLFIEGIQVTNISHSFETATKWIMWCHCTVKPIIYLNRNKKWRKMIGRYLCACLPNGGILHRGDRSSSSSKAAVIHRDSDTGSQTSIHHTSITKEEIANRNDQGLPLPKEAWSEKQFFDLCSEITAECCPPQIQP